MWLGGIPEQSTLEVIKQILLDSTEFQCLDIDQVQLIIKITILKPGKYIKGNKKVSSIHVVVPENKKAQATKSLKEIHPSIPRQHFPEGIQWRAIEHIVDRDFTVTEQSNVVVERMKCKQNAFLQDLCTTECRLFQMSTRKLRQNPTYRCHKFS